MDCPKEVWRDAILRLWIGCLGAFFILYMMSGFMADPFTAFLIAAIYETGLVGLVLFYKSASQPNALMSWMYLGLGALLILMCWIWLQVLSGIIPLGLFH